ncbi:asparagine-linked glycosylation 9 protein isoform a [Sanghuangporus baumii]|uniref:Mannosyltransferase n=1 Tax=Sanghuangporus baumii TaxID=108892 RepID=A0A9Q5I019_SANBA|nr:asparagine-linked glycosylation 9 protein isoform a [Sanghuangporus baumii]
MNVRPGTETIRFQRPATDAFKAKKEAPKQILPHNGLLQDQSRRSHRPPWCPSFVLAMRILILIRVSGAMYSNILDCDEVYNFWEPLHYLDRGYGFQTWETSPNYAIRSWAYIALHLYPATAIPRLLGLNKARLAFRNPYRIINSCHFDLEGNVLRSPYSLCFRIFAMRSEVLQNAGMWNASTAFLSSTFAMFTNTLAFSYALHPPSTENSRRTLCATFLFATGAIVGWPFSLALAIPFVLEELFIYGTDRVAPGKWRAWFFARVVRLFTAGAFAALLFVGPLVGFYLCIAKVDTAFLYQIPVVAIDSLAYGRLSIVPWNIIKYNIFGGASRGPDLYGTEPWNFYILNLVLNFNVLALLALLSLPALLVTYFVDNKRVGGPLRSSSNADKEKDEAINARSSPFTLLTFRLLPFYIWFGIFSWQAHKEERFFFPAYPFLAFNAAVALYLIRGWAEAAFVKVTRSPYQASRTNLFRLTTLAVVLFSCAVSVGRILAQSYYFHAPMQVAHYFQARELVRVLNVTGLLTPPPSPPVSSVARNSKYEEDERLRVDLTPIKELNLTLCYGKEWYRFPSHFLIPDGVNVEFVKSEFDGMLPRHFEPSNSEEAGVGELFWKRTGTRYVPEDLNDLNKEDMGHYASLLILLQTSRYPSQHAIT